MRTRNAGALAVAALMLGGANAEQPAALLAQIHALGAKATVSRLDAGDGANWDHVLEQIDSGARPWLNVGLALKPGTDADTGEALSVSMATALLSNPDDVLRLAVPVFGEKTICGVPLIEPSPKQVAIYVARAKAALARVTSADLLALSRRCSELVGK